MVDYISVHEHYVSWLRSQHGFSESQAKRTVTAARKSKYGRLLDWEAPYETADKMRIVMFGRLMTSGEFSEGSQKLWWQFWKR